MDSSVSVSSHRAAVKPESHLENSLPLPVVGQQVVSLAELVVLGQVVPAHGSAAETRDLVLKNDTRAQNTLQTGEKEN